MQLQAWALWLIPPCRVVLGGILSSCFRGGLQHCEPSPIEKPPGPFKLGRPRDVYLCVTVDNLQDVVVPWVPGKSGYKLVTRGWGSLFLLGAEDEPPVMYGFNEDYGTASRPSDVLKVTLYTARVNSGYRPPLEEFFEEPRKTRYCIATHRTLKKNAFFFDPQSGLGKFPTIRNEFNDGLTDCRPWDYLMFFLAEKVFKREAVPPSMAAAERKITFMGYNTDLWFRTLDGGLFKPDKLIYEEDAMDLGDLEGPSVIMVRKEWNISNPARPQLQVSLANDLQ